MNNLMASNTATISDDSAFFELVGDLDINGSYPDARQRRAIEWAKFADRLRSIGYRISIGGPA